MNKFVLGGGKNVVDDNTIHRGARMVFLILNFDTQLGRSQIVDNDHNTFVERFHEDVINQRRHQVKGMMKQTVIGTMGRTHA